MSLHELELNVITVSSTFQGYCTASAVLTVRSA